MSDIIKYVSNNKYYFNYIFFDRSKNTFFCSIFPTHLTNQPA